MHPSAPFSLSNNAFGYSEKFSWMILVTLGSEDRFKGRGRRESVTMDVMAGSTEARRRTWEPMKPVQPVMMIFMSLEVLFLFRKVVLVRSQDEEELIDRRKYSGSRNGDAQSEKARNRFIKTKKMRVESIWNLEDDDRLEIINYYIF